ncbi:MAG: M56 family metallopeptidase [Gemmatimonadaceae bacterium]
MPRELATIQPTRHRSPAADAAETTELGSGGHVRSQPATPRSAWQQLVSYAPLPQIMLLVWLAGMVLVIVRLLVGDLLARRVLNGARVLTADRWTSLFSRTKAQMRLRRHVVLVRSERVTTPAAWGIFRPVIVMPIAADQWNEEQRRTVLLHELAHVERWDCLTRAMAEIVCAIYWFNPLAWWAKHQLHTERERACDDRVLGHGMAASSYAEQLMVVAYSWQGWHYQPSGALPMAKPSELEDRVRRILDRALRRGTNSRALTARFGSVAACLILPLAAFQPHVTTERPTTLAPPMSVASDTLTSSTNDVHWTGTLPAGDTIAIANLVGEIRAEPTTGSSIEIVAQRNAVRDDPKTVQIHLERHDHKVILCSVYPTQTSTDCGSYNFNNNADHCRDADTASGASEQANLHCGSDVKVNWVVRVPAGVQLSVSTVAGNISATGLHSDVVARSVGGNVDVSTTGHVAAWSLSKVNIAMGSTDWRGDLELYAGSGLTVTLPARSSTTIEAASTFGRTVQSDFPLQQRDRGSFVGTRAVGTLGSGGRTLHLKTLGGAIVIRNAAVAHPITADAETSDVVSFDSKYNDRLGIDGDSIARDVRQRNGASSARIHADVRRAIARARLEAGAGSGAGAGATVGASVDAALEAVDVPGTVAASIRAARIGETVDSAVRAARVGETVDAAMRDARIGETIDAAMRAAFGDSIRVTPRHDH